MVQWVHPILNTIRFSKWAPARNVIQADLDVMQRLANEIAVLHLQPPVGMVNVPKSEGKIAVIPKPKESMTPADPPATREVSWASDSDFSEPFDDDYLRNLEIDFTQLNFTKSDESSLGDRTHSRCNSLNSSGINDSGLGNSQSTIKEENETVDDDEDKLSQTLPVPTAKQRREAFQNKTSDCFKSLPDQPSSTPNERGRRGRRGNLRGRRGRRQTR